MAMTKPYNNVIFNALDASVSQTSPASSVKEVMGWAAQFSFTGTPVGTMKVQVSCDPGSKSPFDGQFSANWTDMAGSTQNVTGAGTVLYNVNWAYYSWVRYIYTAASGTGTISGRVNVKDIN